MTVKLTMEHLPAQSKWDVDQHVIDHGDFSTQSSLSSFAIEVGNATPEGTPQYNVSAYFDLSKGNLPRSEQDPQQLRERIGHLLEGAGIEGFEIDGSVNNRDFSVRIKNAEAGTLTRMAGALSTSVELEDRSTAYSIIDKDVATRLADMEAQATGQDVQAYAFDEFELTAGGNFLVYQSNIPGAAVDEIQQEGSTGELDGRDMTQAKTNVHTAEGSRSEVVKALKSAGFEPKLGQSGRIMVDAPITDIAKTLAGADLIPASANTEIQTKLATLKDQFVVSSGRTYHPPVAELAAKANMTVS